ncbi:MAG: glutamine synthetase [Clostridiales bacterium GWB2_37_7]|nr:MAG: glutamine synthetase [Clostridiales bacterium GWB2_37_7]
MNVISEVLKHDLLYTLKPYELKRVELIKLLTKHPEIKFVSLAGVDLTGNTTDERIPIDMFLEDIDEFLNGSIQTDGSSVVLPGIATLNNGKVDLVADIGSHWYIDYNFEHFDNVTGKPVGTVRIPSFLNHNNTFVDSRSVLKNAENNFKAGILSLLEQYPAVLAQYNLKFEDIADIVLTAATELEFWVKTPNDSADIEALSASQELQEQYWKRTRGAVRTALEQSLLMMDKYELQPEMGHKEVGGIKAKLDETGHLTHIMEQLEIDWKYSSSLQSADNEKIVKNLIKEIFRLNGLEVTFHAKPIEGVAGNGKHTHIGVAIKLKSGKTVNLFAPTDVEKDFMSIIGYGALMGLLKNYEIINPFISSTIDSLNRLKPGFEAPICIVASLGHDVQTPSRNRTILIGLVRDLSNPLSTRFEVRSPNPNTNTFLALAAFYQAMLDGIKAAVKSEKSATELEKELSKVPEEDGIYLEYGRAYRSEEDVFEHFTPEERNKIFGAHPATVYENIIAFDNYPDKLQVMMENDVISEKIIRSYAMAVTNRWVTEIINRLVPECMDLVRGSKMLHNGENLNGEEDIDTANWNKVNALRHYLMKDAKGQVSLFNRIREAAAEKDYKALSELQVEMSCIIGELRESYNIYKRNMLD